MADAQLAVEAHQLARPVDVVRPQHAKDVVLDAVATQHLDAAQHQIEAAASGFGAALLVVDLLRTVQADADQEVVAPQEGAPIVVQEDAVGLERVRDRHRRPRVGGLQRDDPFEEGPAGQGRLAALPGDRGDVAVGDVLHVLGDELLEHRLRDPVPR